MYVYNYRSPEMNFRTGAAVPIIKGIRIAGIAAMPTGKKHLWGLLEAKRTFDVFRSLFPEIDAVEAVICQYFKGTDYGSGIPLSSEMQVTFMHPRVYGLERSTVTFHICIEEK